MLVDVNTTSGVLLAKVLNESESTYTVQFLVHKRKELYDYESTETEVEKESISGMYDPEDTEEQAGLVRVEGGFVFRDEDSDYEPSDSESESDSESDDESLVDEDEED
jgi:hypothetical protein